MLLVDLGFVIDEVTDDQLRVLRGHLPEATYRDGMLRFLIQVNAANLASRNKARETAMTMAVIAIRRAKILGPARLARASVRVITAKRGLRGLPLES